MVDIDPVDVFDQMEPDGGAGTVGHEDPEGARVVVTGERQDEVVTNGEQARITFQAASITDPDTGASIKVDDGELEAGFDDQTGAAAVHARETTLSVDTGDALGPVKISGHLAEAEGYGSIGSDRMGLGGHVDVAGADIQVGDQGTHIKAGISLGDGLGFEVATGEDSDGDGYGEWGMKGEAEEFSGDVRFEPGAVYDGTVETGGEVLLGAADVGVQARQIVDDVVEDPEAMVQQWSGDADRATDDAWDQVTSTGDGLVEAGQRALDDGALDPNVGWGGSISVPELESFVDESPMVDGSGSGESYGAAGEADESYGLTAEF